MAKKKKKSVPAKSHQPVAKKPATSRKEYPAKKNTVATFLFGHPEINKKDITEIIIATIFVAFLVFMHLKKNDII